MNYDPAGIALLLGVFVFLIIIKFPIAFSLAFSAFITAIYMGMSLSTIIIRMVSGLNSVSLLAIPLFILAGEIMSAGGISERLLKLSDVIVGRMRGGLVIGNVLASMFFGGISSNIMGDTVSLGAIKIPRMKKQGYDSEFSVCVTITSACQGALIPPNYNMIIYTVAIGGASVGKLFMAGLIPGILLGIALMILCYFMAIRRNYPRGGTYAFKDAVKIAGESLLGLFTIVIITGGVFSGIVTANESAVLACIWAIIVTLCFYKRITVKDLVPVLKRTLRTLVMVMTLVASATAFSYMMTILRIPELITVVILGITNNKYILLLIINLALLALGCVMDMVPVILITAPIFIRVVTSPAIGMDPIHFGIVMMLNLSVGLLTPPIGTALLVGSSIGCIKTEQTVRGMAPFYLVMIAALMLITFVPSISMTIPNLMFGK